MKHLFTILFFVVAAMAAQAEPRFDHVVVPGKIQIGIDYDQSIEPTTVTTISYDGQTTQTNDAKVDDANTVISIDTKDTPTTYTVELKVQKIRIYGPVKIQTANIEDYKFGRRGGATIRALLSETSGSLTYDRETLPALTQAEHEAFQKRFRVLVRKLYKRDADLAAARAESVAKAMRARVAE
ncbi:hypothetical protein LLG95_10635 [bacterium]|nr:hypothetical protein [bacterium]